MYILIGQAMLIFIVGVILLRLGGRKSISQMTIAQTVVMIGIGSLLVQPLTGHGVGITILLASVLIGMMILLEYVEVKKNTMETIFSGKAVLVIKDGQVIPQNLRKIRLTIDRLETRLRQAGIASISDVQYASIEVSGQLGYESKEEKQPVTKGDLQALMQQIKRLEGQMQSLNTHPTAQAENLFTEIQHRPYETDQMESVTPSNQ